MSNKETGFFYPNGDPIKEGDITFNEDELFEVIENVYKKGQYLLDNPFVAFLLDKESASILRKGTQDEIDFYYLNVFKEHSINTMF